MAPVIFTSGQYSCIFRAQSSKPVIEAAQAADFVNEMDEGTDAYIAQGEVLPVATRSFGGIGIIAVPEMARFYRHVLIEKRYPHHAAVAFGHIGAALFTIFNYLGVTDIAYNQPKGALYRTENPFSSGQ